MLALFLAELCHHILQFIILIANAFFRAGYIESWGRGIEKINRECREHGIEAPVYDYSMSGLMLTFKANPQHLIAALGPDDARRAMGEKGGDSIGDSIGDGIGDKLTPTQTRILSVLRRNARISARELGLEVGIAQRNVEQNIAKLRGAGALRRIGPAKGGYWEVIRD